MKCARHTLPYLFEKYKPATVVDVGGGSCEWLAVAKELGARQITGADGVYAIPHLAIPAEDFSPFDAETENPRVKGPFDLAICLEFLEHVSEEAGDRILAWLTENAKVILFSAAIPGQGGINHINERWASHWVMKFAARGFIPFDFIRPLVWTNENISVWYRQNILVFASAHERANFGVPANPAFVDLVHPEIYARYAPKL
jgi:hypothetical protein